MSTAVNTYELPFGDTGYGPHKSICHTWNGSARNKMMGHYQIVVPDALINTVLKVVHDSPLGGHCGINNTLDRAKEHFFFPRMGKIHVDSCKYI
jgi:hypothetical protein